MGKYCWKFLVTLLLANNVLAQKENTNYFTFFPETKSSLKLYGFKNETTLGQHGVTVISEDVFLKVIKDTTFRFVYSDSVFRFKEVIFPFPNFKRRDLKRNLKRLGYRPARHLIENPETQDKFQLLFYKTEAVLRLYR